jgi:hypothetical protein
MSFLVSFLSVPLIIFVAVIVFLLVLRVVERLDRKHMIFGSGSDSVVYHVIIATVAAFFSSGFVLYFISGLL